MPTTNWFERVRVSALFSNPAATRKSRRKSVFDRTSLAVEALESRLYLSAGVTSHSGGFARIVNGTPTTAFPSVGLVGDTTDGGHCTGTLIGSRFVLTAAHCVDTTAQTLGTFTLDDGRVFQTSRIFVHPGWDPNGVGLVNDIAIMELSEDVTGVTPSQIYRDVPQVGQLLTLVGYGAIGDGNTGHDGSFGVKHMGTTPIDGVEALRITWNFDDNTESNTAPGDSGGPAFVTVNGQDFIAGITSGGQLASAAIGDFSFDTRVDAFAAYIDSIVNVTIPTGDQSDSAFGALNVLVPSKTAGTISPSTDQDWFSFDAVQGRRYAFSTEDVGHPDTTLSLFDRNGVTLLLSDNDAGPNSSALIEWEATATGRFFLRVASTNPSDPSQVGDYRLSVGEAAAGPRPTILSPIGDIIDITPTFDWTPAVDAVRYELQVVNLTVGGTAIHNTDILDTSYTDPTELTPGHSFSARVRGINANGVAGEFSETVTFTVNPIQIEIPRIESLTSTTSSTAPTFQWSQTLGASVYDIWVNDLTTGQNAVIRNQGVRSNTFTPTVPLVRGHQYIWTVRGIHASGTPGEFATHARFEIVSNLASPQLIGPVSSSAGPNPQFTWSAVPGAARYDLWVNNLSTGQNQVIRETNIPGTAFQAPVGLVPGDTYIWTVRAFDSNGFAGAFSPAKTFRVASNVTTPELQSPTDRIDSDRPTFNWVGDPNAVRYDIWINNLTDGNVLALRNQNVTSTSFTPATPLPAGKSYVWTVRAIDGNGTSSDWAVHKTFVINVNIGTPTLTAPVDTANSATPTFRWSPVAGAAKYDLWVNDLTTGVSGVIREKELLTTSFAATNLEHGHNYLWTVRAIHTSGVAGTFAAHKSFRIVPGKPVLIGPTGATSNPLPTFQWQAVTGAVSYTLFVAPAGSSTQIIYQENLKSTSFTSNVALTPGTTYQWWVRATNSNGVSGRWSDAQTFSIPLSSNPTTPLAFQDNPPADDRSADPPEELPADEQDLLFASHQDDEGLFALLYREHEAT